MKIPLVHPCTAVFNEDQRLQDGKNCNKLQQSSEVNTL